MIYLLLIADSFEESALDELRGIGEYRMISGRHNLIIADVKTNRISALDHARFIYSYFPLMHRSEIDKEKVPAIDTRGHLQAQAEQEGKAQAGMLRRELQDGAIR